jgi:hypothetical protein
MSITRVLCSKIVPVCALVVGLAAPAMAQTSSKVDVSGGYNLLHMQDETIPGGWYADVAGNVAPMVGVVGQVSGNYKTVDGVKTKLHTFMAGVRVNGRTSGVVPYAEALVGEAHATGNAGLGGALSVSASENDAAVQLGGGIKAMPAGSRIGAQVGVDYVRLFGDADTNALRFAAGVVVGF